MSSCCRKSALPVYATDSNYADGGYLHTSTIRRNRGRRKEKRRATSKLMLQIIDAVLDAYYVVNAIIPIPTTPTAAVFTLVPSVAGEEERRVY